MRSHRRPTRAPPKHGRAGKLAALWLGIALAAAGFGTAAYKAATRPPDPVVRCDRGGPVEASTLIIVDTTDALTEIQRRRLKTTIETERDLLARGAKLTVVEINADNSGEPVELVSACDPGSANDANPLFETVSKTGKRWTASFAGPVETAITKAGNGAASEASPIIATIAAVLTRPDFDARVPRRRLVLISDMLEHEKGGYSQLHGGDLWQAYVGSALPAQAPLDLQGVAVAIDYLARPAYARVQGTRHRAFWQRLFRQAGASAVTFIGMGAPRISPIADQPTPAIRPAPAAAPRKSRQPRKHRRHP